MSIPEGNRKAERTGDRLSLLRNHPLFRDLPPPVIERLGSYMKTRRVARGTTIFAKGDPGSGLMGVLAGTIKHRTPTNSGASVARCTRAGGLPRALAIASFLIYASTIFALPQVRDTAYCCEQTSFAAAVSNIVYGSRIGSMYTGVFDMFMTRFTQPFPKTLDEIRAELPAQPVGQLSPTTLDANGVGYPLVATAAFRLFGFHWWAPIAVMLTLMAASMAAFLRRFPPILVTLYFCGLTLMLFTVLVSDPAMRMQISVGSAAAKPATPLLSLHRTFRAKRACVAMRREIGRNLLIVGTLLGRWWR
jgi:hypothetical protein